MIQQCHNGIYYQYVQNLAKPTVVLAHPLGMNLSVWDSLVPELTDDFSILRFDLPGHGQSEPIDNGIHSLSSSRLADDLISLCNALKIDTFHFIGTSIGGLLGQQLLVSHSERIASAILTNTGMKIGQQKAWLERQENVKHQGLNQMAEQLVPRWFSAVSVARYPRLLAHWQAILAEVDDHSYGLLCAWIGEQDMSVALTPTEQPILLIAGDSDIATPEADLRKLGSKLDEDVLVLNDVGHVPSVEAHVLFNEIVCERLKSVTASL